MSFSNTDDIVKQLKMRGFSQVSITGRLVFAELFWGKRFQVRGERTIPTVK